MFYFNLFPVQRKIKPEEWEQSEILFDELNPNFPRTLAKVRNNDRVSLHGIRFSKAQILEIFPPSPQSISPSIDRIPCTELLRIASSAGWDFYGQHSLHLIDLQDAIRQGGLDGALVIWGRSNRYRPGAEDLVRQEPLDKILQDHWREGRAHLFAARENDNFHTYSWTFNQKGDAEKRYFDLHVGAANAVAWLKSDAAAYRGKTKR